MFFSQLLLAFRCRLGKGFFCLQLSCIKTFSLCISVSNWLRTPPLTEPEENALPAPPTVMMMGTVDFLAPSDSAL